MLAQEELRAKFSKRLGAAPVKVRRAVLRDLAGTHANLGRLLAELEGDEK